MSDRKIEYFRITFNERHTFALSGRVLRMEVCVNGGLFHDVVVRVPMDDATSHLDWLFNEAKHQLKNYLLKQDEKSN